MGYAQQYLELICVVIVSLNCSEAFIPLIFTSITRIDLNGKEGWSFSHPL